MGVRPEENTILKSIRAVRDAFFVAEIVDAVSERVLKNRVYVSLAADSAQTAL